MQLPVVPLLTPTWFAIWAWIVPIVTVAADAGEARGTPTTSTPHPTTSASMPTKSRPFAPTPPTILLRLAGATGTLTTAPNRNPPPRRPAPARHGHRQARHAARHTAGRRGRFLPSCRAERPGPSTYAANPTRAARWRRPVAGDGYNVDVTRACVHQAEHMRG